MKLNFVITYLFVVLGFPLSAQPAKHSPAAYGEAFSEAWVIGFKLGMPLSSASDLLKESKISESGMGIRTECSYSFRKNGLKKLTCYFGNNSPQPLYEIIFEFEDTDTLKVYCNRGLGPSNHPRLKEHWIIGIPSNDNAIIIWRFENKLIMASNLAGTELAGNHTFELDQAFKDEFLRKERARNGVNSDTPTPPGVIPTDHQFTQTLKKYIENAPFNFENLKREAIASATNVYFSFVFLGDDPGWTQIRKKDDNTWSIESKIIANRTINEVKLDYQALIKHIEGLDDLGYKLVKKTEGNIKGNNTCRWKIENMDGRALGIYLEVSTYIALNNFYAIKIVVGKTVI